MTDDTKSPAPTSARTEAWSHKIRLLAGPSWSDAMCDAVNALIDAVRAERPAPASAGGVLKDDVLWLDNFFGYDGIPCQEDCSHPDCATARRILAALSLAPEAK